MWLLNYAEAPVSAEGKTEVGEQMEVCVCVCVGKCDWDLGNTGGGGGDGVRGGIPEKIRAEMIRGGGRKKEKGG